MKLKSSINEDLDLDDELRKSQKQSLVMLTRCFPLQDSVIAKTNYCDTVPLFPFER